MRTYMAYDMANTLISFQLCLPNVYFPSSLYGYQLYGHQQTDVRLQPRRRLHICFSETAAGHSDKCVFAAVQHWQCATFELFLSSVTL